MAKKSSKGKKKKANKKKSIKKNLKFFKYQ